MATKNSTSKLNGYFNHKIPWVTLGILILNIYFYRAKLQAIRWGILNFYLQDLTFRWDFFLQNWWGELPKLLSYTLVHNDLNHILWNMGALLLFAPPVERAMGKVSFLLAYLAWGAAGALMQGIFSPFGGGLIGASGAVFGAAGAYFVLFPLKLPRGYLTDILPAKVKKIPSFFLLGLLFIQQLQLALGSLIPTELSDQITRSYRYR
jgi:membrane associated rhomboid family serine protease